MCELLRGTLDRFKMNTPRRSLVVARAEFHQVACELTTVELRVGLAASSTPGNTLLVNYSTLGPSCQAWPADRVLAGASRDWLASRLVTARGPR